MSWLELYFAGALFVLGLIVGSFLNVVIVRLPRDESIVSPGSHCVKCNRALNWYENIPVFSWVLLRGKCRTCHTPISPRYALVELMTGVLYLACWKQFGWTWQLTQAVVFVSLLIPLVFIDAELWILPYELTLPGLAVGLLLGIPFGWAGVKLALIGAAAGFLTFRLLEFFGFLAFRKETLGAGDKFLLAMVGAFLGYRPLGAVVGLSAIQGALFGLVMLAVTGRAGPSTPAADPTAPDAAAEGPEEEEPVPTFSPAFLAPGLSFGRRLLLIPYTLFLQPIPDEPPLEEGAEEEEWVPGPTNMPFGPWIGLAAVEVLLLRPWLVAHLQPSSWTLSIELLFGL